MELQKEPSEDTKAPITRLASAESIDCNENQNQQTEDGFAELRGKSLSRVKYTATIQSCITPQKGISVDVYCVLRAFNVSCPAVQHAVKKLLKAGKRGSKTYRVDLLEALTAIERAVELNSGP